MDRVIYDATMSPPRPYRYRTAALYGPDLLAMRSVKPGQAVQVIAERGDDYWTDGTLSYYDSIEDGMVVRYHVTVNGTPLMVSADRIRKA